MDEPVEHGAKWNKQTQKEKKHAWSHLCAESKELEYVEAETGVVVTAGGEVGEMERCRSKGTKL